MYKKLVFLISFVFVLGLVLPSVAEAQDPNLDGWWKFDGDPCDSSGNEHNGTIKGDPCYVAGYDVNALNFDGAGDYVVMSDYNGVLGSTNRTCAAWIKKESSSVGTIMAWGSHPGGTKTGRKWIFRVVAGGTLRLILHGGTVAGSTAIKDGRWHHVAAVLKGNSRNDINFYVDGLLEERTLSGGDGDVVVRTGQGGAVNVQIGRKEQWGGSYQYFDGLIDDARIYKRALSDLEIWQLGGDPNLAWNPRPVSGSTVTKEEAKPLTWSPGQYADKHDVYFDTDETKVTDANRAIQLGVLVKQDHDTNSYDPGALEMGKTYFWRIDEVNDTNIWQGYVWSFGTVGYLPIDDFEDYNDNPDLWNTWSELGQAWIDLATDRGRGASAQSMQIDYLNSASPYYSETDRLVSDPNFKRDGVKALSLWFYGKPDNDANEQMYVALEDSGPNRVEVTYEESDGIWDRYDQNDLLEESWHRWDIDLQEFAKGGVKLTDVQKIAIGLGDGIDPSPASGNGLVWFDDIRLVPPRCRKTAGLTPDGRFAGWNSGCVVDNAELEIMADDWLAYAYTVTAPGTLSDANLEAHYKFEGNLNDSSDNLRHADPCDPCVSLTYVAGHDGNAVSLDGTNYVVHSLSGDQNFAPHTVALWVKTDTLGQDKYSGVFSSYRPNTDGFQIDVDGENPGNYVRRTGAQIIGPVTTDWVHLAVVDEGTSVTLYYNGYIAGTGTVSETTFNQFAVGVNRGASNWFEGMVDDVRIYSRVLSHAEILYLAKGPGSEVYQPLSLSTNNDTDLYDDESINFKDFAKLADAWLKDQLWPE